MIKIPVVDKHTPHPLNAIANYGRLNVYVKSDVYALKGKAYV